MAHACEAVYRSSCPRFLTRPSTGRTTALDRGVLPAGVCARRRPGAPVAARLTRARTRRYPRAGPRRCARDLGARHPRRRRSPAHGARRHSLEQPLTPAAGRSPAAPAEGRPPPGRRHRRQGGAAERMAGDARLRSCPAHRLGRRPLHPRAGWTTTSAPAGSTPLAQGERQGGHQRPPAGGAEDDPPRSGSAACAARGAGVALARCPLVLAATG